MFLKTYALLFYAVEDESNEFYLASLTASVLAVLVVVLVVLVIRGCKRTENGK